MMLSCLPKKTSLANSTSDQSERLLKQTLVKSWLLDCQIVQAMTVTITRFFFLKGAKSECEMYIFNCIHALFIYFLAWGVEIGRMQSGRRPQARPHLFQVALLSLLSSPFP